MKGRFRTLIFAGLALGIAGVRIAYPASVPVQQDAEDLIPESNGEHLRIETEHGPIHLWRPADYDPRTAGMVIYIHGYFASVDQAWADNQLATQFGDSARNALFLAVEAPQSSKEDVSWNSLEDLLCTARDRAPYPLPRGPLVIVGHSGAYRTILTWLGDPRVQYVILLDGLYSGQAEFRAWLHSSPTHRPHRMVLVSSDTWRQCNRLARRIPGTARRRSIPAKSSSFTLRETRARLLFLRSQYDHNEIINSGKVIPVLLGISPISSLAAAKPPPKLSNLGSASCIQSTGR